MIGQQNGLLSLGAYDGLAGLRQGLGACNHLGALAGGYAAQPVSETAASKAKRQCEEGLTKWWAALRAAA